MKNWTHYAKVIAVGLSLLTSISGLNSTIISAQDNNESTQTDQSNETEESTEEQNSISQYTDQSIDELVHSVIDDFGLDESTVAVAYYHFPTGDSYYWNEHRVMPGASTTKVGIAQLYYDLVSQGVYELDSHLNYPESYYEDGGGNITNSPWQPSYSIDELIYESLYHSDNTALNILVNNYYNQFGDPYHKLIEMANIDVLDDQLYGLNEANAVMLNQLLIRLASSDLYAPIIETMRQAQPYMFFKTYLDDSDQNNMAVKYGRYMGSIHDTGIYYDDQDQPIYALVVMTDSIDLDGLGITDEFLGTMNREILDWTYAHY